MKQEDRILVKIETAAEMFDCSVETLKRLEQEKKIKAYTIDGKRIKRYRVAEIDKQFIPL